MRHEKCYAIETDVVDSRFRNGRVYRRRVCRKCKRRFTTWEILETDLERMEAAEKQMSELKEPRWAVIDSSGVRLTDLRHAEAVGLVSALMAEGVNDSGLTIVTAEAAERQ